MADLGQTRRQLTGALVALACIDAAALVVLLSPAGRSRADEIRNLEAQLRTKTRQVQPLRGLDKKVVEAKQQIAEFYRDRLPAEYSQIDEELGKLATENGTKLTQAKYHKEELESGGLRPVTIEAALSGDYLHVVKFINALERDKLLFMVNSIALGDSQAGTVKLQLKLQTYLKSGA
jgi:type IV pilus assembly protein PilO